MNSLGKKADMFYNRCVLIYCISGITAPSGHSALTFDNERGRQLYDEQIR